MVVGALGAVILSAVVASGTAGWDPWDFGSRPDQTPGAPSSDAVSPQSLLLGSVFWVYRNVVSPVNGSNCPMYPSCSRFSRQAIDELGPMVGLLATFDRLHRCGHDLHFYQLVLLDGRWLRYDPPTQSGSEER